MAVQAAQVIALLRQRNAFDPELTPEEISYLEDRVRHVVEDLLDGRHDEPMSLAVLMEVSDDLLTHNINWLKGSPPASLSPSEIGEMIVTRQLILGLMQADRKMSADAAAIDRQANDRIDTEALTDVGFSRQTADDIMRGRVTVGQVLASQPESLFYFVL